MKCSLLLVLTKMARVKRALFLFFYFFVLNSRAEDRIIDCSSGTSNLTLCLQFQNYSLEFCEDYKDITLAPQDKNYIVSFHNTLRTNIAKGTVQKVPKGFYMKKLSWNQDLAKLAQKWAEQCQSGKVSDFRLFQNQLLGRNVALLDAPDPSKVSLEPLMNVWSAGLDNLTPDVINSYKKPTNRASDFEPAAQMIWWNTSEIGCSRSTYKPVKCTTNEGKKYCARNRPIVQLVCTYFPVGNRVGEPIYNTKDTRRYICQYENNEVLCTSINERRSLRTNNEPPTKKKESYRDTMITRMRNDFSDIWPVTINCAKSLNLNFLLYTYVLFFFIFFMY